MTNGNTTAAASDEALERRAPHARLDPAVSGTGPGSSPPERRPPRRRARSLRVALGSLVVAVLLPLGAAGAAFLVEEWQQQREAAFARLQDAARTLQRAVDRELILDQAVLRTLAESAEIDRRDWRSFHVIAAKASAVRPESWFVLYDRSDQTLVNTRLPLGAGRLPNFRALASSRPEADWEGRKIPMAGGLHHVQFDAGTPSFSGLIYSPVLGRPAVGTNVPVMRDGRPVYGLSLVYSSRFYEHLLGRESGPGLTAAIFDARGRFIARNRDSERFVGLPGPQPFREGSAGLVREGIGEAPNVESVAFVFAYRRSAVADVVVAVGMPKAAVLAPAWRALWAWVAVLAFAATVGALFAIWLWRRVGTPLAALAQQARTLGDVRLAPVPSGIEEVEALRLALDDAAKNERVRREVEREREEARRNLRASEQRFRAIFEDAAVGIVELEEGDRIVAANGRFCAMLGHSPEELVGRSMRDLAAREDADATCELHPVAAPGELRTFEHERRYVRRDGTPIWLHLSVAVVREEGGRLLRAIGTASDVTDRRRAEAALHGANAKLVEADRRKDEFLGMLSHELRNPLAPIRNSTYILRHAPPGSDQAQRARAVIERQTAHLTRLVDDLLDVTRIARGKIELRRARVDLRDLLGRAADDFRLMMDERGVAFRAALPDAEVWVEADATRITQVVGNLLHNAAKFTRRGDEVALSLEAAGGEATIRVRDTGAGIDPALRSRLFAPFVQGERTLARTEGGLGLGLALVRGIAELHGGTVSVESAGQGKGAEFAVRLPRVEAAGPPGAGVSGARLEEGRRRVLVVDDNADAADSLAELVGMLGHAAEIAHDGPSAIEKVRASRPDLVLCDIGLPGMSGYEVAKALRGSGDAPQLFALSGYAQPEDVAKALEAGFDGHLAKPAKLEDLERLLGQRGSSDARALG